MTFDAIAGQVNRSTVSTREIYAFPTTRISINGLETKLLQFADDTTSILSDLDSASSLIYIT